VTRAEAAALLARAVEIDYVQVGDIFQAFGFHVASPTFEIEVYYHPRYHRCGKYTARDPGGNHVITAAQQRLIREMLACVEIHEQAASVSQQEE
jgi:hypothetical protein